MLQRLRSTVQTFGWPDALTYIVAALIERLTHRRGRLIKYYFVAQPVQPAAPAGLRACGSMRLYRTDTLDEVIGQAARAEHVMHKRFAQGAHCIVAERDGELAGCIWLCPSRYREDEVRCVYRWAPAGWAVWDFDVYVAPRWRISRLFARLWERAHAELRSQGVRWTLSRIDAFNAGSLAAHRKLGARTLARGWFLVLGPVQLSVLSTRPFVHLTWRPEGGPQLCFDLTGLAPQNLADPREADAATAKRS